MTSAEEDKDLGAEESLPKHDGQNLDQEDTEAGHPDSRKIEEAETISILDLMDEADDLQGSAHEGDTGAMQTEPTPADSATPEDEATPTGSPIPAELPAPETPPLPLMAPDLIPVERPTISDEEATRVQPRSAFPGQTQLYVPPGKTVSRNKIDEDQFAQEEDMSTLPQQMSQPAKSSLAEEPTQALPRRPPVRAAPPTPRPVDARIEEERIIIKPERRWLGCLSRFAIIGILLVFISLALGIAGTSFGYITIASQLPLPSELRERASTFETAQILDRNGRVLYSLADPTTGNRSYVPLSRIDQDLENATIATEDARFYTNPGFDPLAITRAVYQAALEGEVVSGASTITQQLARALLLDEDERTQRTFSRKVKEIVLAAELFRTYPKEEILELYLNEIYYGNRSYGIEAAAQTYFRKSAEDLNLAEASLLAGLPQAPALWDPFTAPNKALGRQREVLSLMLAEGFISAAEARTAIEETQAFIGNLEPPNVTIRYPHFFCYSPAAVGGSYWGSSYLSRRSSYIYDPRSGGPAACRGNY